MKLGALFSTGKDSNYALYLMQEKHDVACLISLLPKNKNSFMYHKPNKEILKIQSQLLGIPLIIELTKGEKEKEMIDLKKAIKKAKEKYLIKGIVTGALHSKYQKKRIEKIAKELKLKVFNPLWGMNQEQEVKELIEKKFEFILSKIACYGLNKDWLGKKMKIKELNELKKLKEKIGINVSGEGGEYESLVLSAPNYSKKIEIEFENKMENEFTGEIKITKIKLKKKLKGKE